MIWYSVYSRGEVPKCKPIFIICRNISSWGGTLKLCGGRRGSWNRSLVRREIFPDGMKKERKHYTLLDQAHIGARYNKSFIVFYGDIDYLAPA
jgi:hypothetical protein